ncbi:hypothetical protein Tco_0030133, partial [Tanacetum coccineum]
VNTTTSVSGSKPSGNTKKNRRPPSSDQKNKVEEHPRKVKSSLNKMNSVSEPISNAHVKHFVRNAKFKSICAICRTFTIVRNMCPLTRITSTKVVSTKETINKSVLTPTQRIIVYSRICCPNCSMVFGLRMLQAYDWKSLSTHQLRQ